MNAIDAPIRLGRPPRACAGPARSRRVLPMRRVAAQKGFSLLEVLVAFVILALVATALFRLFGGALGNAGIAEDASRAVLVAQSRLDAARASPRPGSDSGVEEGGRIAWSTRVEAWTSPDAPQAGNPAQLSATQLYRVSVEVRYPGAGDRERTLALSTLRLARREGTP